MTKELKRFEQWWDAEDDIPNDGPYTPDTPIQFAWAGWQAALAKPEQEPLFKKIIDQHPGLAEELKAMDATEQEPVAWQWLGSAHFRKKLPKNADITAWNPLYTTPPQRTWVGLSDAELVEFSSAELGPYDLCLEVEAKLKEKNT